MNRLKDKILFQTKIEHIKSKREKNWQHKEVKRILKKLKKREKWKTKTLQNSLESIY
jgi:hypothetical protein